MFGILFYDGDSVGADPYGSWCLLLFRVGIYPVLEDVLKFQCSYLLLSCARILMDKIPAIGYDKGILMIREKDISKVKRLIKEYGAHYNAWKVIPSNEKIKKLRINSS